MRTKARRQARERPVRIVHRGPPRRARAVARVAVAAARTSQAGAGVTHGAPDISRADRASRYA